MNPRKTAVSPASHRLHGGLSLHASPSHIRKMTHIRRQHVGEAGDGRPVAALFKAAARG
jgi:hypothetical protein